MIAVLTPITSPREFTSGPPELPGLSAASAWITSSISRPAIARRLRPAAGRRWPADADHRDVGVGIVADQVRVEARTVGDAHLDSARAVHHVAVGEDEAVGRKHESRAAAAARRFAFARAGALSDLDV